MKNFLLIYSTLFIFFASCSSWPYGYYYSSEEAAYTWRQGGAEPGDVYASQAGGQFRILRYDPQDGTQTLHDAVFAVQGGELDSAGVVLPCLFFKKTANDLWSGMKLNGDLVVTNVDKLGAPVKI